VAARIGTPNASLLRIARSVKVDYFRVRQEGWNELSPNAKSVLLINEGFTEFILAGTRHMAELAGRNPQP
jgi:hypothetical protein